MVPILCSVVTTGRIPYAPTPSDRIDAIFDILPVKGSQGIYLLRSTHYKGKTFIDIGSGDGVIVSEAAFRGFNTIGYEINPW